MSEKENQSKSKEQSENQLPQKKGHPVLLSRSYRFIAYLVMVSI